MSGIGADNRFIGVINRIGQAIILNIWFLLCSIPIVTLGASLSAFYYAMAKTVRRERSYPTREFFGAFKRNLKNGCIYSVIIIAVAVFAYISRDYYLAEFAQSGSRYSMIATLICDLVFIILALFTVYVFPLMSRFNLDIRKLAQLTVNILARHLLTTLGLIAASAVCVFLCLHLPIMCILMVPAAWCYAITFLLEPVMKKYTPKPENDKDAWYYE